MASTEIQGADASPVSIAVVNAGSSADDFAPETLAQIEKLLPEFLASRRWFRSKARPIREVRVEDVVPFSAANSLHVLDVAYADGGHDTYLLPLALTIAADDSIRNAPASEPLAVLRAPDGSQKLLYSAFANPVFRGSLLAAVGENKSFTGRNGKFSAHRTAGSGIAPEALNPNVDSTVSRAEQSNTSVVYGDNFILKLFRKIEAGVNPDVEVGVFLTEHGFRNTPAVVGTLEYKRHGQREPFAAGLLGAFVANRGDAWKYSLDSLAGFFKRALPSGKNPVTATASPEAQELIGDYLAAARLLGQRTAEMHAVLATGNSGDFIPEHMKPKDSARLHSEMNRQADTAFALLREKLSTLPPAAADLAHDLLAREGDVRAKFENLRSASPAAPRIRFHGDYHLGQVLYTGSDFMIIDFEGEPARPLEERREKSFALRDVAGMVRSFQYAAYAALFGQVAGVDLSSTDPETLAQWAAYWYAWASDAFLAGYFETAGKNAVFLGPDANEHRMLLDAFLLHKALYEVAYELNNRPGWVRIPLRGILDSIVQG